MRNVQQLLDAEAKGCGKCAAWRGNKNPKFDAREPNKGICHLNPLLLERAENEWCAEFAESACNSTPVVGTRRK